MQVDVLALTDHDSVDGIHELMQCQTEQSRPLTIIPGTELSTRWRSFEIHIVGLNVDYQDAAFKKRLQDQAARRHERAVQIADKLAKAGIEDCLSQVQRLAGVGHITRAHFARVLVQRGIVSQPQQAFNRYLGKGKRAYVNSQWISIEEAVKWIHDAGGKAVVAHPGHYDMKTKWLRRLLTDFCAAGGDGMEVCHPGLSSDRQRLMAELANKYGLQGSVGSDFHFPGRWTELGRVGRFPENLEPVWKDWTLSVA